MNDKPTSVSELNRYIKEYLADDGFLTHVWVEGEAASVKYSQGHLFFLLKDDKASIGCSMWNVATKIKSDFRLKDGDKIALRGAVDFWNNQGKLSLNVKEMKRVGDGELAAEYERLKKELAAKGYFDSDHKKPIPAYVKKIGVVTSPTGQAIRDIIKVSREINPYVEITLFGTLVQGKEAAASIANGIEVMDGLGFDVLLVGRGGGDMQDLWAFNEMPVVEAIYNADTPIISCVGHQGDFTLADEVADLRAATPSDAAKLANFSYDHFEKTMLSYEETLERLVFEKTEEAKEKLKNYQRQLHLLLPQEKIKAQASQLSVYSGKLYNIMTQRVEREKSKLPVLYHHLNNSVDKKLQQNQNRLALLSRGLDGLSPLKRLDGGFGYVGINTIKEVEPGSEVTTILKDGSFVSVVKSIKE